MYNFKENSSKIRNAQFDSAKGFAILSVICAHISSNHYFVNRLFSSFGLLGVGCFLFLAGYFFYGSINIIVLKKKIKMIVIPWLMCSSFTYFLSILISPNSFNIISYISWVFGIGTWYYFVPVLFGCYVIFSISNSNWWSFFLIIINIICINLTMKGYISDIGILTKYINVFNWVGYFAIGMICKKFDLISKFNSSRLLKLFSVFFCFIMLILNVFLNINISYWGELSIITIISGVFTFLAISSSITFMNDIGKKSYANLSPAYANCWFFKYSHIW